MSNDIPGDNSRGIGIGILVIVIFAGLLFGMRNNIGISKNTSWVVFIAIIGLMVIAFLGYIPGVGGAWCTDSNGYTTRYKAGKCFSNPQ